MPTVLQKTKLFPPVSRFRLANRPRLLERLDGVLLPECKIGIISASAGSGKTTLVNQWLAGRNDILPAWVSLDDRDNESARFFRYLISGLQTILPEFGGEALDLLQLPGLNLEELVTLLCNDLTRISEPIVVVLDDFHVIMNPLLLQAMDFFVDAKPPSTKIILVTREDPVLSVSRWRAKGQLVEIRQEDLRFDLAEAIEFLNLCMGLRLSNQQVEILESQTEGWIAGLQLVALALQQTKRSEFFIQNFSGTHRFILDYLMDEVFTNQPVEIQKFLLETSILDRLCAELCARVTGLEIEKTRAILERLVRANLFVFPLDDEQRWYRYHHLFKDLLSARLLSIEKEQVNQLFFKAAIWFEENGDARLAVEHALKGKNSSLVADLIERHVSEYWRNSDLVFMFLIEHLPEEEIIKRPSLCLHLAWAHVLKGKMNLVPPLLDIADKQLAFAERNSNEHREPLKAFAKILRTYMLDFQNQSVICNGSLDEAYAMIPDPYIGMRNSVAIIIGTIYYMENDFVNAMKYFKDALERDIRNNGYNAIPIAVQRMAWVFFKQGQLREAMDLLSKYEKYVRQRGNRRFYIAGVLNLLMGEIFLEWNILDEAKHQILEGLRLINDWPSPSIKMIGYCAQSQLQIALHNLPEARRIFSFVEELQYNNQFHPEFQNILEQTQIFLCLAEKNHLDLESYIRKKAPLVPLDVTFRNEAALIGLSRAWLVQGRYKEAEELLARLLTSAGERKGIRINLLALLAVACKKQVSRSEQFLEDALRLAEPEGYMRTFLAIGEPFREILKTWFNRHQEQADDHLIAYVYKIILAFETNQENHSQTKQKFDLPEPLSQREIEVLHLVEKGLTNQQIASDLVISIRTVKKHIENILGKLGVQNRTQAATRARSIGLLDHYLK